MSRSKSLSSIDSTITFKSPRLKASHRRTVIAKKQREWKTQAKRRGTLPIKMPSDFIADMGTHSTKPVNVYRKSYTPEDPERPRYQSKTWNKLTFGSKRMRDSAANPNYGRQMIMYEKLWQSSQKDLETWKAKWYDLYQKYNELQRGPNKVRNSRRDTYVKSKALSTIQRSQIEAIMSKYDAPQDLKEHCAIHEHEDEHVIIDIDDNKNDEGDNETAETPGDWQKFL